MSNHPEESALISISMQNFFPFLYNSYFLKYSPTELVIRFFHFKEMRKIRVLQITKKIRGT